MAHFAQLDENFDWQAPVPMPETGGPWIWNEQLGNWEEISASSDE